MEKLFYLTRYRLKDKTVGIINIGDRVFRTIGLPWKDNKNGVSCHADGKIPVFVDLSPNKKWRSVVEMAPFTANGYTRSQCQFHYAEDISWLEGCEGMKNINEENELMQLVLKGGYTHVLISTIND